MLVRQEAVYPSTPLSSVMSALRSDPVAKGEAPGVLSSLVLAHSWRERQEGCWESVPSRSKVHDWQQLAAAEEAWVCI